MALQGIDISSWQSGIDLNVVPCDFVIAKATQGTNYINPDCSRAIEQARSLGKPFGVYHYINGSGAVAEADYFLDNITNWIGKGMLCLDWESNQNSQWGNESYLRQVAQRVIDRTGIPPMIYVQQSRMGAVQPVAKALNCGLWIAQYGSMNTTGYQDSPWNEGAYSCAMRQYASTGRLSGYSGNLDLNKFYGDVNAWNAYAGAGKTISGNTPSTGNGSGKDEWISKGSKWWYRHADGSYTVNDWESINNHWYHFDSDGWMQTGWLKVGKKWYWLAQAGDSTHPEGAMYASEWVQVEGKWYYLTASGAMATGWIKEDNVWYYADDDGKMHTGWLQKDGEWYWLNADGSMSADTIQTINGKFYAFDEDGKMLSKAIQIVDAK